MALAQFRKVERQQAGEGRFVVSEGIAPSEYLLPHESLPTLFTHLEDDRHEIVIVKGTLLSLVTDSNGDSRVVPANGTGDAVLYEYGASPTTHAESVADAGDQVAVATAAATGTDFVVVPPFSTPIGAAQYNLYRPFDKGTSQGSGWITRAYVEYPAIQTTHDGLAAGSLIRSDAFGRPVVCTTGEAAASPWVVAGRAIAVEKFATNFDDGLLSYMQMPSDPGSLKEVYELTKTGPNEGRLGIRANLNVQNVVGAFRMTLNL